jgi:hypothetical protein
VFAILVWHSRPRLWISVSDFADDAIPVILTLPQFNPEK